MNELISVNEFKGNEFIGNIGSPQNEVDYFEKSNCPICGETILNEYGSYGGHIFDKHNDRYKKQTCAGSRETGEMYITEFYIKNKDTISKETKNIKLPPYLIYAEYKDTSGNFKVKLCEQL